MPGVELEGLREWITPPSGTTASHAASPSATGRTRSPNTSFIPHQRGGSVDPLANRGGTAAQFGRD
jgi:hypothetical protein